MKSFLIFLFHLLAIGLSGQQTFYPLESSANVTCFSNLTVVSIQWMNAFNNDILLAVYGEQKLVLNIERITSDINTEYTCEVFVFLPTGSTAFDRQSFILNYNGMYQTHFVDLLISRFLF